MKCGLCQKGNKLVKSHIIPEYFYYGIYQDDVRRLSVLNFENNSLNYIQKGFREKLFCEKCESIFNVYETEFKNIIYGFEKNSLSNCNWKYRRIRGRRNLLLNKELPLKSLQLLQLSILWRASISGLEIFRYINLGPHNETIRKLLLQNLPNTKKYNCTMIALEIEGEPAFDWLSNPVSHRILNIRCYQLIFGGFMWVYFVCSHKMDFEMKYGIEDQYTSYHIQVRELSELHINENLGKSIVDILEKRIH